MFFLVSCGIINRLRHANFNSVREILKLYSISTPNKVDTFTCKDCNLSKAIRIHSSLSTTVYSNAFDIIYTDLWGPSPQPSSFGFRYYVAFVDGSTTYT